jgi:linoleoyl-CoA desaturase
MSFQTVKFSKDHNELFYKTLKQRVNAYFKDNQISRYANATMVTKTILLCLLYFIPFIALLTYIDSAAWAYLAWTLMGFGMAGLGLSVMHDANHGAYSKNEKVNKWVGYIIYFIGGSDVNWRIQHNILHHTYTNVTGMDEDINPGAIMRFSPHEKRRKFHRYQHVYAWFFYGWMTIMWYLTKDYKQAVRYEQMGLTSTQQTTFKKHLTNLIVSKIAYTILFIIIPAVLVPYFFLHVIAGFFLMQFIAGLTLACIFQPAHVVPTSDYPVPDNSGNIDADWAVSQLCNTANFAPKARLLSWYVGGLNYQVEHHLFPNICHVHYRKLSEIVKQTAHEFELPYHSYKSFIGALKAHTNMLKMLGRNDIAPAIHH